MNSTIFDHKPFEEMTTQELEIHLQKLQAWRTPAESCSASAVDFETPHPTPRRRLQGPEKPAW